MSKKGILIVITAFFYAVSVACGTAASEPGVPVATATPTVSPQTVATAQPTLIPTTQPTSTPQPTPTALPEPTATPLPTPTATLPPTATLSPAPTDTPPPTATPRPTATRRPSSTPNPRPTLRPTRAIESYNFQNCTELRKVFPNGVRSGHPAYQPKMDRDKDGWACERS